MSMGNAGKQGNDIMKFADNEAKAGEANSFGLALTAAGGPKTNAYWVVSTPSAAQNTLKFIDRFIETVDSKRAALGAIQNHSCDILAA